MRHLRSVGKLNGDILQSAANFLVFFFSTERKLSLLPHQIIILKNKSEYSLKTCSFGDTFSFKMSFLCR